VVDGVKTRLADLRQPARRHDPRFYDRSDLVSRAVFTVEEALLEATSW
jgi:cobalt-zinc-cadmium resistance protein CzcA